MRGPFLCVRRRRVGLGEGNERIGFGLLVAEQERSGSVAECVFVATEVAQRGRRSSRRKPPRVRWIERMSLVTSARFCEVERAWSKGGEGRPAAREATAKYALVTAGACLIKRGLGGSSRCPLSWLITAL